jgi:CspA family cold shock protein
VHFSAIAAEGYRYLVAGQHVAFRAEAASQDGFAFRAVRVWTGVEPAESPREQVSPDAYRSTLTLTFDGSAGPDTAPPQG